MTEFTPNGDGFVSFAGNAPGRIKAIELKGNEFLAQKDAFLCAQDGVDLDIAFTKKLGAGLFGGEGFILERLGGNGTAFIHACGDFAIHDGSEFSGCAQTVHAIGNIRKEQFTAQYWRIAGGLKQGFRV